MIKIFLTLLNVWNSYGFNIPSFKELQQTASSHINNLKKKTRESYDYAVSQYNDAYEGLDKLNEYSLFPEE